MRWAFLFCVVLTAAACSDDDGGADTGSSGVTDDTAADDTANGGDAGDDTGSAVVTSTGIVRVGDDSYELDFSCLVPEAGDVLAVGIGRSPDGDRVEAFVQAFDAAPYVGLRVGAALYEAAFDGSLQLFHQEDEIRASAIRFVADLDLDTGDGDFVGLGSVDVVCESYDTEVPATGFE